MILPNSAQKQIKILKFVVSIPAAPCFCYELEISWENIFTGEYFHSHSVTRKIHENFNFENFRLYGKFINLPLQLCPLLARR